MAVFPTRTRLRDATADAHDAVDAAFGAADLTSDAGYAAFLSAQARAHLPVEAALEAGGIAGDVSDWPERKRAAALRGDLTDLGVPVPPPYELPRFQGLPERLGALYVLEGSRLGGTYLVRQVPSHLPRRFLGAGSGPLWRSLLALLDERLPADADKERAVTAARSVFGLFERAAATLKETSRP